jgi:hypothetical protein
LIATIWVCGVSSANSVGLGLARVQRVGAGRLVGQLVGRGDIGADPFLSFALMSALSDRSISQDPWRPFRPAR